MSSPLSVWLSLKNAALITRLIVHGNAILNGRLAHQIKPGEQIWMVEELLKNQSIFFQTDLEAGVWKNSHSISVQEAADGKEFVVCELDKLPESLVLDLQ